MSYRNSLKVREAFTLVELLVVIGIIAVLIAVLLPMLRRAREAANAAVCLSNIHQISMATLMCANDHRGYMPSAGRNGLWKYDLYFGAVVSVAPVGGDSDETRRETSDWIAWA